MTLGKNSIISLVLWFIADIFIAVAPPTVTEKIPNTIMFALNEITLHTANSKNTDLNGNILK